MNPDQIEQIRQSLAQAQQTREAIAPLSRQYPSMTLDDAYAVQKAFLDERLRQGARLAGRKIGITSRPVQQMFGVDQPDFGCLFADMAYGTHQAIPKDTLIQPKAEGEIAFVLKRDLSGPGLTAADVLAATEGVMACFEIVDSRIRNWEIGIVDTVADNASSGAFVLGDRLVDPRRADLTLCGMVIEKNGQVAVTGAGAAVLGSPVNAVVWLANQLGRYGEGLKAGDIVLSGSLAAMVPAASGDHFRMSIAGIGSCSVFFD